MKTKRREDEKKEKQQVQLAENVSWDLWSSRNVTLVIRDNFQAFQQKNCKIPH